MEKQQISLLARVLILATLLVSGIARAQDGGPQSPAGPAEALSTGASATNLQFALSTGFTYQGRLDQDGSPVSDTCDMRFKLYDAASLGVQVGSTIDMTVPITDGLFTVTLDFPGAFSGDRRWLGIEVDCEEDGTYTDLGRQELTAVPYALYAAQSGGPKNVIAVAKSGGDYASVQAAIDSITDAAEDNAYLVWVAPGVYSETVTMKSYVHLQGAGQEVTVITSTDTSEITPPDQATLTLARDTSVRDLTVGNIGAGSFNAALLATDGTTRTLVADVTALAQGGGSYNYAVFLAGGGTGVTLQHVTGLAENSSGSTAGLYSIQGADVVVHGGSFTARGGSMARSIYNSGSGTTLKAEGVTARSEDGDTNLGLQNNGGAKVTLHGGTFTVQGGITTRGLRNYGSGTTLDAKSVTVVGENGSGSNHGLYNRGGADAVLHGGSFIGRGGTDACGIGNHGSGTTLEAAGVTSLAEDGSDYNYGLCNDDGAAAALHGGSFTARGGDYAYGIDNADSGTTLETTGVTSLAEDGSTTNYSLSNISGAAAILHGGSFIGRGGTDARGIDNADSGTTLEATGVTSLAEDGSTTNYGLSNAGGGAAMLHDGSFTARGGNYTYGIDNTDSGTTLEATDVTSLAEDGSDYNYGLYNVSDAAATLHDGSFTGQGKEATYNYGLYNYGGAAAMLHGGSFTACGGTYAWGISSDGSGTTLEVTGVTALADYGSTINYGLSNAGGADAVLRGGSFTARGGTEAHGVYNHGSGTMLEATGVTVLAEKGNTTNYGLFNALSATAEVDSSRITGNSAGLRQPSGTVSLGVTQLDGGASKSGGILTCFQVYDGSYTGYTCP